MQRLIETVAGHKAFALLSVCVVASLTLLGLEDGQRAWLARATSVLVSDVGQRTFSWGIRMSHLWNENTALREENMLLSLEVSHLQEYYLENKRLRALLGFSPKPEYETLPALVIGHNVDRVSNSIVIAAGAREGLEPDMPVVTSAGLVGRVLEVTVSSAVVQILLDHGCRVSAVVQNTDRAFGIVHWAGGEELNMDVSAQSVVAGGDRIASTGMGGVFPKGMVIGTVTAVAPPRLGLVRRLTVAPAVDFGRLEEVFVLRRIPAAESDEDEGDAEAEP